jgi:hypothetical protein
MPPRLGRVYVFNARYETELRRPVARSHGAALKVYVSVNTGGSMLRMRPRSIHLVSNEDLSGLQWTSWGRPSALATGSDHGNGPTAGHSADNPVPVRATRFRRCGHHLVYTAIRLHHTAGTPCGTPTHVTFPYGSPLT